MHKSLLFVTCLSVSVLASARPAYALFGLSWPLQGEVIINEPVYNEDVIVHEHPRFDQGYYQPRCVGLKQINSDIYKLRISPYQESIGLLPLRSLMPATGNLDQLVRECYQTN